MLRRPGPLSLSVILALIILTYQFCSLPSRTPAAGPFFKLSFKFSSLSNAQLAQLQQLTFCFSQIKFIPYVDLANPDPNASTQTFDFDLDDIDYSSAGSSLTFVSLTAGKYESIQMKLSNQCSSGRSMHVTNNNGIFSTTSNITLTFLTNTYLEITDNTTQLTLDLDGIIPNLLGVSADNQVRTAAETNNGDF